ncbi:hypothetical protein ACOMHN_016657 [Nucella lapillus]
MAAAAAAAGGGEGRGDAEVDEIARQLEDLNVGPQEPQPALQKPVAQGINITEDHRFVYFDLETTGFGHTRHITQIAARSGQDEAFSTYVLPKEPIHEKAQKATGITCDGKKMYHHGKPVPFLTIRPALEGFITFLEQGEPVVLLGHHIKLYDCPILLNALQRCNLVERFQGTVYGCVDTLPLFREINPCLNQHNQVKLYEHYIGGEFPAHDAKEDVRALQQIVNRANPNHDQFSRHSFTFDHIIEFQPYQEAKAQFLRTWKVLVERKVISKTMANKAAEKGLSWEEVVQTFQNEGVEQVKRMLRERLTCWSKIIDKICAHLEGGRPDN